MIHPSSFVSLLEDFSLFFLSPLCTDEGIGVSIFWVQTGVLGADLSDRSIIAISTFSF